MEERRLIGIATIGALCVSAGVAAGLDAVRHVNGFYLTTPAPRYHAPPLVETASIAWDWNETPGYPVASQGGWPAQADRDERAFFDDGLNDPGLREAAVGRPVFHEPVYHDSALDDPPVRVGRGAGLREVAQPPDDQAPSPLANESSAPPSDTDAPRTVRDALEPAPDAPPGAPDAPTT